MLDEHAMPIPRLDETADPAPEWVCDDRIGIIRFPGGASVTVQGDDMRRIDAEVDQHGPEILWNYLEIARERSAEG